MCYILMRNTKLEGWKKCPTLPPKNPTTFCCISVENSDVGKGHSCQGETVFEKDDLKAKNNLSWVSGKRKKKDMVSCF